LAANKRCCYPQDWLWVAVHSWKYYTASVQC